MITGLDGPRCETLSERELAVLQAVVKYDSDIRIAHALGISRGTVRIHLASIYRKLGVRSRLEAVTRAIRQDLIHLE